MPPLVAHPNRRAFLARIARGTAAGAGLLTAGCPGPLRRVHVVGSGVTGLCAGALLAKAGCAVHVLEARPDLLGGHAASFARNGFQFTTGPQYVWGFQGEGIGARVLEHLSLADRAPFDTMDRDGFEMFGVGDATAVSIPMGLDRFRDVALDVFPADFTALNTFFSYLSDLSEGAAFIGGHGLYLGGECLMRAGVLLGDLPPRVKLRLGQCAGWTLTRLFDQCGLSEPARRFLFSHAGLFLERESEVSCLAYAAGTGAYHGGAQFPRRGFQSLVDALADHIVATGGSVEMGRRVARLVQVGNRVAHVECADGETYATDLVVSTVSPRLTCALLERQEGCRVDYGASNTGLIAYLGVRGYPDLPATLDGRNLWWQDGQGELDFRHADMRRPPRFLSVSSPSAKGTQHRNANPEDHSVMVFAPASYAQAAAAYALSPEVHDALRAEAVELLLDRVEEYLLPGLRPYLRSVELDTPYDIFQRTGCELGSVYGRRMTPEAVLTKPYAVGHPDNLHIACATTGLPGIAIAFQTAALLAEGLTGVRV